jgi:hypothetical protein
MFGELWSFMDSCIGLIIACLPSLRPYFDWKEKIQYYGEDRQAKQNGFTQTNDLIRSGYGGRAGQCIYEYASATYFFGLMIQTSLHEMRIHF